MTNYSAGVVAIRTSLATIRRGDSEFFISVGSSQPARLAPCMLPAAARQQSRRIGRRPARRSSDASSDAHHVARRRTTVFGISQDDAIPTLPLGAIQREIG
jgi:hypothetical protein